MNIALDDFSVDVLQLQFELELIDLCSCENCDTNLDPYPEHGDKNDVNLVI